VSERVVAVPGYWRGANRRGGGVVWVPAHTRRLSPWRRPPEEPEPLSSPDPDIARYRAEKARREP
jgi:hypothetical protein